MRIKKKTIWDMNMTARKKIFRRMMNAGHRESEAVEWYTLMDTEAYRQGTCSHTAQTNI